MTNKKLKVNSAAYTELSIQIAVLQASVDKLLQLAMKDNTLNIIGDVVISGTIPTDEEFLEAYK
jgi:hypothetical protein